MCRYLELLRLITPILSENPLVLILSVIEVTEAHALYSTSCATCSVTLLYIAFVDVNMFRILSQSAFRRVQGDGLLFAYPWV